MDSAQLSTPASAQPPGHFATASDATSSPALSFFSKGYSARSGSSTSSLASSPNLRESIDGIASAKRLLEDVTEEPHERETDFDMTDAGVQYYFDDREQHPFRDSLDRPSPDLPSQADYAFDPEASSEGYVSRRSSKKQRSGDFSLPGVTSRFGTRFPSLSKRWHNKSGAGPQLSIITLHDNLDSRTSSASPSQLISPALSAISKHESYIFPSPVRPVFEDETNNSFSTAAIDIDRERSEQAEDQAQATTPLLPPIMDFTSRHSPIQSPLQSPAVADAPTFSGSTTPVSTPQLTTLPSPPLSTKPSIASFHQPQRSRAGTMTKPLPEIPVMQTLDQQSDAWSQRLGHANFNIEPEPYLPEIKDLQSYRQLRTDWDLARFNYGKHLARTGEHYGATSKIYLLTEEKWADVDSEWKKHHATMASSVEPMIARLSDGDTDQGGSVASSAMLEKPLTKVIVPQIDESSGKFPELGDEDIIGPMAFAPSRFEQTHVEPTSPGRSRKRSFIKFISDILGRGTGQRL